MRARLRSAPGRNVAKMQAAEQRLTERLASFFAATAQDVSRQISVHLGHNLVGKGSDHASPDLHVKPENAIPIDLPSVDVVTQANVQHVSWELVREGQTQTTRRKIAIADLIATQKVVDQERLAKHMEQLRETGELDEKWPPLVLRWDGDFFLLSGHHGTVAAKELGWTEIPVDVMIAH
ncbi:MAG TPA: hypothetical protein VGK96_22005 [Candidatus Sulfotelmatobacter sp.]